MNGLQLVLYNNTRIVCVCLSVCLSNLSFPEWEVLTPRHLRHLEKLLLTSCTNFFSSPYETPFERKSLWNFFPTYDRYPEREVVSPRCLPHPEQLCLASCTNCFLNLYDAQFEGKSLGKFFASYAPNSRARTVTFPISLGRMIQQWSEPLLNHSRRSRTEGNAHYLTGNIVAITDICLCTQHYKLEM